MIKVGFIDAFSKLRKSTVSFVMSVGMELLDLHRTDFYEMSYLKIFRKCVEKFYSCLLRVFRIRNLFIEPTKWATLYVGHLESKERLCIQPAQLFNFS